MVISEADRHHLYEAATRDKWDSRAGETLMSMLPPVGWAEVATKSDLASATREIRSEIAAESANLRSEMTTLDSSLRNEMTTQFASVREEITHIHSKMELLEATLTNRLYKHTRLHLASMIMMFVAFCGLTVAVA